MTDINIRCPARGGTAHKAQGGAMPYWADKVEGNEAVRDAVSRAFSLRGKVSESVLSKAEELEWEYSSFSDPGPDWCRAHFRDAEGHPVGVVRVEGY